VTQQRMHVSKYLPEKLYGFAQDASGAEVFFHLGAFQPGPEIDPVRCPRCSGLPQCQVGPTPPPPILGEAVEVGYDPETPPGKAPRATRVVRLDLPAMLLGRVDSFDPVRRYGFIQGADQVSYHLHQSEITDGRLPMVGGQVIFFAGTREGRPRACHVRVCR